MLGLYHCIISTKFGSYLFFSLEFIQSTKLVVTDSEKWSCALFSSVMRTSQLVGEALTSLRRGGEEVDREGRGGQRLDMCQKKPHGGQPGNPI